MMTNRHRFALRVTDAVPGTQTMPTRYRSISMARAEARRLARLQGWTIDILDDCGRRIDTVK